MIFFKSIGLQLYEMVRIARESSSMSTCEPCGCMVLFVPVSGAYLAAAPFRRAMARTRRAAQVSRAIDAEALRTSPVGAEVVKSICSRN